MHVQLNPSRADEMSSRADDVDALLAALHARGRPEATRESAFLSWSDWSDSCAASWLSVMPAADQSAYGRDEIVAAHDALLLSTVARVATEARRRQGDERILEIVRDHLSRVPTDPEDPDLLTVSSIAPRGMADEALGVMRADSSTDAGLLDALVEGLGLELPAGWDERRFARGLLTIPLGLSVVDASGFAA